MSLIEVKNFNVAAVYVEDFEEAFHFYTEILGLKKTCDQGDGVLLTANDQLTVYLEGGRAPNANEPAKSVETCLCFWPECGVTKAHELLKSAGIQMVGDYMPFAGNFHMFRCCDPSGNVIEFAGKP